MSSPQPSDNADPGQLEDRLRSMILANGTVSNADSKPAAPLLPPGQPDQAPFQHHGRQHHQPHDPARSGQHHNARYSRQSRRGRPNARGNFRTQQPQPVPGVPNNSMDPQLRHSHHVPQRMMNRAAPSNFAPLSRNPPPAPVHYDAQWQYLEHKAMQLMSQLEMSPGEVADKDQFRIHLERALQDLVHLKYPEATPNVALACFGSVASGFGMPGSDMDLALVSSSIEDDIFRLFEKHLLDMGHGAHLLAKTRVPILKVCQNPTPELLAALREERQKWDDLSPEQREMFDHPARVTLDPGEEAHPWLQEVVENAPLQTQSSTDTRVPGEDGALGQSHNGKPKQSSTDKPRSHKSQDTATGISAAPAQVSKQDQPALNGHNTAGQPADSVQGAHISVDNDAQNKQQNDEMGQKIQKEAGHQAGLRPPRAHKREWYREKKLGPLDFPKDGVGVQCDINFANPLGLHNTQLLRCYSHCDARVRLMVLFVKAWASKRKINSARNGTLSSYGYVLMVLHFLVNVATPPVCPNLQLARKSQGPPHPDDPSAICDGWDIRFWRNETEIRDLAAKGMLTHNREPLGMLLRDFFRYYAQQGHMGNGVVGFAWMQSVLSLRTPGGLLSKEFKGWTGAKTTVQDNVEVRHRYLFAIEDPFEIDHNVARPVTHNGIVAIRDEFRRAWRILMQVGRGQDPEGDLLEVVISQQPAGEEEDSKVDAPAEQGTVDDAGQEQAGDMSRQAAAA